MALTGGLWGGWGGSSTRFELQCRRGGGEPTSANRLLSTTFRPATPLLRSCESYPPEILNDQGETAFRHAPHWRVLDGVELNWQQTRPYRLSKLQPLNG